MPELTTQELLDDGWVRTTVHTEGCTVLWVQQYVGSMSRHPAYGTGL